MNGMQVASLQTPENGKYLIYNEYDSFEFTGHSMAPFEFIAPSAERIGQKDDTNVFNNGAFAVIIRSVDLKKVFRVEYRYGIIFVLEPR